MLIGPRNYTMWKEVSFGERRVSCGQLMPRICLLCSLVRAEMKEWGSCEWLSKLQESEGLAHQFSLAVHRGGQFLTPYSKPRKVQETASLTPCFWKWSLGFDRGYGQQKGFPGGSDCKESACNSGDLGSLPRLGRSPAEGNSYPLQYSCLGNSMERGAWRTTVHWGHKASYMTERLTLSQATKLLVFKGI